MCEKYFEGRIPEIPKTKSALIDEAIELKLFADGLFARLETPMRSLAFSEALAMIWELVDRANRFIEKSAPWALAKENKTDELKGVLSALIAALTVLSKVIGPFMPHTAESIRKQLGADGVIAKGTPLFPRIETKKEV
jgi:methionyl-tRNA synthetase